MDHNKKHMKIQVKWIFCKNQENKKELSLPRPSASRAMATATGSAGDFALEIRVDTRHDKTTNI